MQNVVLIVHLLLALTLIGVVLLQRSEGGGLGIGGGDGNPSAGRPPLTALAKVTWGLAVAFIITSLWLTIIAAQQSATTSVLDRLGVPTAPAPAAPALPGVPTLDSLLPPPAADDTLAPPPAD
ncbi:MAG: preprotein translocase subunit SecG [Roseinatronobacter sp.]